MATKNRNSRVANFFKISQSEKSVAMATKSVTVFFVKNVTATFGAPLFLGRSRWPRESTHIPVGYVNPGFGGHFFTKKKVQLFFCESLKSDIHIPHRYVSFEKNKCAFIDLQSRRIAGVSDIIATTMSL